MHGIFLPRTLVLAVFQLLAANALAASSSCPAGFVNNCAANLPSTWCCPSGTQCISLNNTASASAICCPQGQNCTNIQPISCDISFQDANKFPNSSIHTLNTNLPLPKCGNQCCPLGFECQNGSFCRMSNSTVAAQSATTLSSTPSSTSTSASKPTSTSSGTSSNATTDPVPTSDGSGLSSGKKAAIGILTTLAILSIIALAVWYFFFYKNKKRKISEPIYDPQMTARTVFVSNPHRGSGAPRPASSASDAPLTAPISVRELETSPERPSAPPTPTRPPIQRVATKLPQIMTPPYESNIPPPLHSREPEIVTMSPTYSLSRPSSGLVPDTYQRRPPPLSSTTAPKRVQTQEIYVTTPPIPASYAPANRPRVPMTTMSSQGKPLAPPTIPQSLMPRNQPASRQVQPSPTSIYSSYSQVGRVPPADAHLHEPLPNLRYQPQYQRK